MPKVFIKLSYLKVNVNSSYACKLVTLNINTYVVYFFGNV